MHVDLDRLAISPQCGFASSAAGNPVSEQDQWAKLRVLVEAARAQFGRNRYTNRAAIQPASAIVRSSSPTGPTICSPTGMPFGPVKAGTVRQGPRINVQTRLNAEFDTETRSATASPHALGVISTSQRSNTARSARWHASACDLRLVVLRLARSCRVRRDWRCSQ